MTATLVFYKSLQVTKVYQDTENSKGKKATEPSISLEVIFNFVFSAIALTEDSLIKSLGGITGFYSFLSVGFYCILKSEKSHIKM